MFKRKQKTPKPNSLSASENSPVKQSKEPFLKRLVSYFKTHRKTRLFVFGLIGLAVSLALLFTLYKLILVLLGTIMQFWFRYTSNEILLWVLTLLCFAMICGFLYFLWVRRSEYLRREEQEDKLHTSEVVVDDDWFQSDNGWQ
jgi:hypothetical protein